MRWRCDDDRSCYASVNRGLLSFHFASGGTPIGFQSSQSIAVTNTGESNAIAASVLSHVATSTRFSRFTHAPSSLCVDAVRSMALGNFAISSSRLMRSWLTAAGLDPVHQHDDAVEHLLGTRRASRDVDVDGEDLIDAGHRVIVLVEAAAGRAHAESA